MKKRRQVLLSALFLFAGYSAYSQTVNAPYTIGTWPGFRNAAINFTFDDACRNQFSIAIPLFNEFGFQLTLFVPTGTIWLPLPGWDVIQNAAAQGHEVASHTITHTNFKDMSDSMQTVELRDSKAEINAHIPGRQCVTMAYPFCVTGNDSIVAQYYIAARGCSGAIESPTPSNFMNVSSIICGTEGPVKTTEDFIGQVESSVASNGWCVFLLHGLDVTTDGWSPVQSTVLRETLDYLASKPGDYWVTSFGNTARYSKERDAVSVNETVADETHIVVRVTDTLPDSIFSCPITVRRPLPEGWSSATVTQKEIPIESHIVEGDGVKQVQFDAVPDGGDVVIVKNASAQRH